MPDEWSALSSMPGSTRRIRRDASRASAWTAAGYFASSLPAAGEEELVAIGILEHREAAPGLFLRRRDELDAARDQFLIRLIDVVGGERAVEHHARLQALLVEHEQHQAGVGRADAQLDPALLVVERLIREHLEADLLGPELERARLVVGRDADELHV